MGGETTTWREDRPPSPDETPGATRDDAAQAETADGDLARPDGLPEVDGALGRLVDDYLILDRLGTGGMGVVYRALQRDARRLVALKVIRAESWGESTEASDRQAEVRLRNEAQALAQLEHDHIVPIYDVGHADGLVYFSMRLIPGRSLAQMIRGEGPMAPRRAAAYLEPIARAVQYAHDHRVVHRDLKPGNVMVDQDDRPYLIDLGLCKSLEATDYAGGSGRPLGTAEYMAPEQARGDTEVGFAADIYGLGATLFALLTGRPPFTGASPTVVLRRVIDEEPEWPPEHDQAVGRELKAICLKCLEKDPSRRFRSAGELAEVLRRYLNDEPTGVVLPGAGARLIRWVRRQPWRAAAVGIAVTAAVVVATAWAAADRRDRETARAFVRDLPTIPWPDLPRKIREMEPWRGRVAPGLHALLRAGPADPGLRTRIGVALLPAEPSRAIELADRLLSCGPEEHRAIREALRPSADEVAPRLRKALEDAGADTARRIRAAAALIALDAPVATADNVRDAAKPAWSLLRSAAVPDPRIELLDWLVHSKIEPAVLVARLERESDASVRRTILLALAEFGDGRPPGGIAPGLPTRLLAAYHDDPDPGIHSSLAYLLRRWGLDAERRRIDAELAGKPCGPRRWLVTSLGQTMAVLGPVDATSSRSPGGASPPRFAIATTETTLGQYRMYDPDHAARARSHHQVPPTDPDRPADAVSYVDAARFCNWLSRREGLPPDQWCYLPGVAAGSMVMAPDYRSRPGYRLPSLREWEYAARAGTLTDRYFGQSLGRAAEFAWFNRNTDNRAEPVGLKRPNDFGLFDILGNLLEWCYNPDPPHEDCRCGAPRGADCRKGPFVSMRGGSFHQPERGLTAGSYSPTLDRLSPEEAWRYIGFRIAKSVP
jgi:formylglycine-generating enzyme required for sulfatase activity